MTGFIVPQAYLDDHAVSDKSRTRLESLARYDLSAITNQLMDRGRYFSPDQVWPLKDYFGKMDMEIARLLENEFKRFVSLTILEPNNVYAPPGTLDMYWHFFVLHTREYARFCAEVWGDAHDHGALPKDIDDIRSPAPSPVLPESSADRLRNDITLLSAGLCVALGPEVLRKIYLLEHWDLSFFTERLENNERRFSPEQIWPVLAHFGIADKEIVRALEREFKKFIILTLLYDPRTLVPSGPVDMYWHFLILHTKEYREFSQVMWGRFRHYPLNPAVPYGCGGDGFATTLAHYTETFGHADPLVWHNLDMEVVGQ